MPEWWTYRAGDFLMFTARTWYRLIELYNGEIWPAQLLALAAAILLMIIVRREGAHRGRWLALILGVAWLWVGWGFLWRHYATIQLAARQFSVGFGLEGALLIAAGFRWRGLVRGEWPRPVGLVLLGMALAYPLLAPLTGRSWRTGELFGLMPDPTALATLGVLLATGGAWFLYLLPLLWCLVSWATLIALKAPEAWVVAAGALLALGTLLWPGARPGTRPTRDQA